MEDTVAELLGRAPNDGVALVAGGKEYKEETFYTTCHKTANLFNHLGLREGGTVVVPTSSALEAFFGFLGAALVGATVEFRGEVEGADVLLCDVEGVDGYDVPSSCSVVVCGDGGEAPAGYMSFKREIWGENPVFPHELRPDGDTLLLKDTTSAELVDEARQVVEERSLWNGDEVSVESLNEETAVKLVAGLVARATVVVTTL